MNNSLFLNVSEIPSALGGFSKIYCDYLTNFQKVKQYYEYDFHSIQNYIVYAENIARIYPYRNKIVEILERQNINFGVPDKTIENIQLLKSNNTLAIVTGQQVGIFSGPLYTIYKVITTIKLTELLNESLPNFKFVPIFWLEGEDHDFSEMNYVQILNAEHNLTTVSYSHSEKANNKNFGPIGEIIFNETLPIFFEQIQRTLQNSEFKQDILNFFRESYYTGTSFNKAFTSLLSRLFPNAGLIFISSNDKEVKQLLKPIIKQELETVPQTTQLIIEKSAELELHYHAQIKPRALNLFLFHKGGRYLIEPKNDGFSLKGTRQHFSKEELYHLLDESPEMFSPNVVLRPICQDTILPTLCYVAGPSEIAYFAQLKNVYSFFNLQMPIIYPRASVTLLEQRNERILEKYELNLIELFSHPEKIVKKVMDIVSEINIDELFNNSTSRMNEILNEMKFGLNYLDPTLLGALETTREKIELQLQILKEKTHEAQKKKHEIALRQIQKVTNNLLPNKNLQERELNIIYFLNKHGFGLINRLLQEIQIDKFQHQIIRI